jgi:hypothetical protein
MRKAAWIFIPYTSWWDLFEEGYMTRRQYARRLSRRTLVWRVFYGGGELVGQGSIIDVHENGCRITGCMPVEVGTHLRLCIWPTDNPTDIVVVQGTVRWARGLEFGLHLDTHMPNLDQLLRQDAHRPTPNLANPTYNHPGSGSETVP